MFLGYSQTSKAYTVLNKETIRIEESLNVTFDESLLERKSSPSVKDDRINEPIVQDLNGSPSLQVKFSNEGYPKSLKEARGHPIEQVIDNEDANEYIEIFLEIADLFTIPDVTQDQIMLRIFPISLTGAASRWIRNETAGLITT
ncbi:hypothetical protein Tco_0987942 [Tanacetum coccineum]